MNRQVRWAASPPPSPKASSKTYSSEYLGWKERKPKREFDPTKVDRYEIKGGPATETYETMVRGLFRPQEKRQMQEAALPPSFVPSESAGKATSSAQQFAERFQQHQIMVKGRNQNDYLQLGNPSVLTATGSQKVSATAMKRVEEQLGKDALDDSNDDELWKSPLEAEIDELMEKTGHGSYGRNYNSNNFPIYTPKTSKEYFTTLNSAPPPNSSLRSSSIGNYRLSASTHLPSNSSNTFKDRYDSEWQKTNRQMLVDYKEFDSSPLSPYMYQSHPYVHNQDSRIVGSNFVQLTTRPRDRFLEKIDKTLAEVRSSPRYTFNN